MSMSNKNISHVRLRHLNSRPRAAASAPTTLPISGPASDVLESHGGDPDVRQNISLIKRALRSRYDIPESVRGPIVQFLSSVALDQDPLTNRSLHVSTKTRISAVLALLAAERVNIEYLRLLVPAVNDALNAGQETPDESAARISRVCEALGLETTTTIDYVDPHQRADD